MKRIVLAVALCCLAWPALADTAAVVSAWSPGPLYVAAEPFLLAIVNGVVIPLLLGWGLLLLHRFTNLKLTDSQRAEFQTTAQNAAGRIFASAEPEIAKLQIPITSPLIAAEVPKVEAKAAAAIQALGITPERVADAIQAHVGRLQASAQNTPSIVVPVIDAKGSS